LNSTTSSFVFYEGDKLTKRSDQLVERHKHFKYGKENKVVDDGCCNSHYDAGDETGKHRRFLCFMEFIDKPGSRNKTASHDKISKLPDAAGGRSEQLQGVFLQVRSEFLRSGHRQNAPISAGKSDRSIRANDGDSGTGNSKKASTKAMAESTAVIVSIRTFWMDDFFCMATVFIILLSRYDLD